MKTKMVITVGTGIMADKFDVEIIDITGKEVFKGAYYYGYTASFDKTSATINKPHTYDILDAIVEEYNVDIREIEIVRGKNVFADKPVDESELKRYQEWKNRLVNKESN